ncbi:MAG TPA: oligoribonuclease [Candidatus Paceibacterota bacterium]
MSEANLAWVDVETTGLDEKKDIILEVALAITDIRMNVLEASSWVVDPLLKSEQEAIANMTEFVRDMHTENGLLREVGGMRSLVLPQIAAEFIDMLHAFDLPEPDQQSPLCGSSVSFDRKFLAAHTSVLDNFSYREINVSSFKETVQRFTPWIAFERDRTLAPAKLHRALSDIHDTIDEYTFYLNKLRIL